MNVKYPASRVRNPVPRMEYHRPAPSLTCPNCKRERALTPSEARRGYQCRDCADIEEGAY